MLENVLEDFNIKGEIVSVKHGPIVTLFELKPAPGTKTSTVISLSEDIARFQNQFLLEYQQYQGEMQ